MGSFKKGDWAKTYIPNRPYRVFTNTLREYNPYEWLSAVLVDNEYAWPQEFDICTSLLFPLDPAASVAYRSGTCCTIFGCLHFSCKYSLNFLLLINYAILLSVSLANRSIYRLPFLHFSQACHSAASVIQSSIQWESTINQIFSPSVMKFYFSKVIQNYTINKKGSIFEIHQMPILSKISLEGWNSYPGGRSHLVYFGTAR